VLTISDAGNTLAFDQEGLTLVFLREVLSVFAHFGEVLHVFDKRYTGITSDNIT
jgi:hypothetical protein